MYTETHWTYKSQYLLPHTYSHELQIGNLILFLQLFLKLTNTLFKCLVSTTLPIRSYMSLLPHNARLKNQNGLELTQDIHHMVTSNFLHDKL